MTRILLFAFAVGIALAAFPNSACADDWGTIKGRVKMSKPPEKRKVELTGDKEHCSSKGEQYYEDFIVDKMGGLKNVVVWLRPDSETRKDQFPKDKIKPEAAKASAQTLIVDQPCCQFIPRVVAVRAGDVIEFKNSAPVPHNVHFDAAEESFNVTIPPGKSHKTQALAAQGAPIVFKCDIHPWMAGRVRVFDHPYFAVTNEKGEFEIKDAPAGKWRLVVWHESGFLKGSKSGPLGTPIEIKGGANELPEIEFEAPK